MLIWLVKETNSPVTSFRVLVTQFSSVLSSVTFQTLGCKDGCKSWADYCRQSWVVLHWPTGIYCPIGCILSSCQRCLEKRTKRSKIDVNVEIKSGGGGYLACAKSS